MKPGKQARFTVAALLNGLIVAAGIALFPSGPEAQVTASDPPAVNGVRFPVAVQHSGSWCYGYLYGSQDRVGLQIVQPEADKKLSFEVPRAEVTVGLLLILGITQDAIELKTKTQAYRMRWLANEGEVKTGAARRWGPPNSLPPYSLIAAMQNPDAALAQGGNQAGNAAPAPMGMERSGLVTNTGNPITGAYLAAGGADVLPENTPQNVSPGMLAGVYVATAGKDARPSNTQYLFYPDGFVLNAVPQDGLLGFDLNHYRPQDNRDKFRVGRYKVEGNEIKILWIDQYSDPANPDEIERNETSAHPAVTVGPQIFIPMCQCTAKTLSGTYLWGPPQAGQYIQFLPDGTFFDNRATDQLLAISFDHPRIQRGRYQIVGQTIIFTFADGHRGTRSFLAPKVQQNNATFEWIDMGWHMLFEQSYEAKLSQRW
jgi:hypothetical protein